MVHDIVMLKMQNIYDFYPNNSWISKKVTNLHAADLFLSKEIQLIPQTPSLIIGP